MAAHETFQHAKDGDARGSDRSFGFVFAAAFLVIALKPLLKHGEIRTWAVACAAVFAVIAVCAPAALRQLNRAWMKIGAMLQKVMNPIIMAILFYAVLTPFALLARAFGQDSLKRRFDRQARTYWITREARSPASDAAASMRNQF